MPAIAFIGLGEFACAVAHGVRETPGVQLRGYSRPRREPSSARALEDRARSAGIAFVPHLEDAVRGAAAVIAAVPASAAADIAERSAPALEPGCLYIDPAPVPPAAKQAAAETVSQTGARFVDLAVLGTVTMEGSSVPMLAAGPGAVAWQELAGALGLNVTVIDGPAGQAALVKLLRSVYMKGRDALVIEMLLAARAYGVEREVVDSIRGRGEAVPFDALARRVVCAMSVYAGRRADELAAAADLLAERGVEPIVAEAGARRLRQLAELGLREHFGGERATDHEAVLAAIDELGGHA